MHLAFVLGTRPEIIKLASLIRACVDEDIPHSIVHTNQHYARHMDGVFFDELGLPAPEYHLGVGSASPGAQTGRMLEAAERVLQVLRPSMVVVQGDTNSTLAGALAASKQRIPVAHVEAGLRSFDRSMPEEINRILTDRIAELLFCPTEAQRGQLAAEGLEAGVHVSGNTVVDATLFHAGRARELSRVHARLGLAWEGYQLLTCHRPANTDDPVHFARLIATVSGIARDAGQVLVLPMHPRLGEAALAEVERHPNLLPIPPVGYLDMLALIQGASFIFTDSGGLQEEACILRRKCLVLRTTTERPETLDVGGALLPVRLEPEDLRLAADTLQRRTVQWYNPFGDGLAYRRILDVLQAADLP